MLHFQIFWAVGTVFEVLLAILVMPTLGWRWLLGLSTIPLFIFAVLCFVSMTLAVVAFHVMRSSFITGHGCCVWLQWLPESARYDVLTGNQEKALATLKRIATENGAPMPLGKLIAARQVRDTVMLSNLYIPVWYMWLFLSLGGSWKDSGPVFISLPLDHSTALVYLVFEVLRPRTSCSCDDHRCHICTFLCGTLLCCCFIRFANAFSYYGLVLLTTELFQEGGACGSESQKTLFSHSQSQK